MRFKNINLKHAMRAAGACFLFGLLCVAPSAAEAEIIQLASLGCLTGPGAVCDNGTLDVGEDCDLPDMGAKTCLDFGSTVAAGLACYPPGSPAECTYDPSGCLLCGNGKIETDRGEECDPGPPLNLDGKVCSDFSAYTGGDLKCHPVGDIQQCKFNFDECTLLECGNNIIEAGEQCEPGPPLLPEGATCGNISTTPFIGGIDSVLACYSKGAPGECQFDTSGCNGCEGPLDPAGLWCEDAGQNIVGRDDIIYCDAESTSGFGCSWKDDTCTAWCGGGGDAYDYRPTSDDLACEPACWSNKDMASCNADPQGCVWKDYPLVCGGEVDCGSMAGSGTAAERELHCNDVPGCSWDSVLGDCVGTFDCHELEDDGTECGRFYYDDGKSTETPSWQCYKYNGYEGCFSDTVTSGWWDWVEWYDKDTGEFWGMNVTVHMNCGSYTMWPGGAPVGDIVVMEPYVVERKGLFTTTFDAGKNCDALWYRTEQRRF